MVQPSGRAGLVSPFGRVYHSTWAQSDNAFLISRVKNAGAIDLHELRQVMTKLDHSPSEAELLEMINSIDDNCNHHIDFEEFLILMKSRIDEQDPEAAAFAVIDTDGSGSINRKELKRLMKMLGQTLTEAELDAIMDEVDTNGDGEISFDEFKAIMS